MGSSLAMEGALHLLDLLLEAGGGVMRLVVSTEAGDEQPSLTGRL